MHAENSFITLTYNDDKIPALGTLDLAHLQNFIKRLRKKTPQKIRLFYCGEYGEKSLRPHYHVLLFNRDFADKILHGQTQNGDYLYTSETLTQTWGMGHCLTGDVTFKSAAYVARYVLKKRTGAQADDHYLVVDPKTGEILGRRLPEFSHGSNRPGIGATWHEKFKSDVYPRDEVIHDAKKLRPPRYYDKLHEREEPKVIEKIKRDRKQKARKHEANNTPERLKVRETVHQARTNLLKRTL